MANEINEKARLCVQALLEDLQRVRQDVAVILTYLIELGHSDEAPLNFFIPELKRIISEGGVNLLTFESNLEHTLFEYRLKNTPLNEEKGV